MDHRTHRDLRGSVVDRWRGDGRTSYASPPVVCIASNVRDWFGEAAGLRLRNVDFVRGRLEVVENLIEADGHLHEGSPKARRARSVPLPRFLRPELAAHIAGMGPEERVFTASRGGPLRNSNFRHYIFDPAVARAGLAPLTPHDLRDTAASLAVSAGANVKTVQRMLGHASAAMTLDIYAGLFDDDLDALGERLSDAAGADHADSVRTDDPDGDDDGGLSGTLVPV